MLLRRLYFVLPDRLRAAAVAQELLDSGIPMRRIAFASLNPRLAPLAGITVQSPDNDPGARLERSLWNLNLGLFFAALAGLIVLLIAQASLFWLALPVLIMLASFIAGERFTHVPDTHLQEFASALRHGEVVLMVSVPPQRVAEIEARVHRHHPDAAVGGVGWDSDLLHA
jgi:hypothetical protein